VLIWAGAPPLIWNHEEPRSAILYVPWLLLLPFIGAMGGYLSGAGAERDYEFILQEFFRPWRLP
jgi:hypothetical protein